MTTIKLKVLIACEYSGITRNEFTKLGWDAWSCDVLDTELPGQHIKGDLFNSNINFKDFTLVIAHPPCTYLSKAGLHYENKNPERINLRNKAIDFFIQCCEINSKYLCIENPIGYINKHILKYSQIVNPYYFGEAEIKTTALWLFNLPLLKYSFENNLFETKTSCAKPKPSFTWINKHGKTKNEYFTYSKNAHNRAKTFISIAQQMAIQFTSYIIDNEKNN